MTITVTANAYLLAAGETLSSVDLDAIRAQVSADSFADITINGRVQVTAAPQTLPPGVISSDLTAVTTTLTPTFYGGKVLIGASGVVDVNAAGSRHTVTGISENAGQQVVNLGRVHVVSDYRAVGISVHTQSQPGGPSQTENAGTVDVTSNSGDAIGVLQENGVGGSNTGIIHVAAGNRAVGLQVQQVSNYTNSGEVVAHANASVSIGAMVLFAFAPNPVFINSGYIEGEVALQVSAQSFLAGSVADIRNSGQLVGAVDLSGTAIALTNTGSIKGPVFLGPNNDVYDGRLGSTTGLISGGDGADTEMGGAGFDNLQGNQGNDSITGGAGDDITVGGKDNDLLSGDAGADVVWGNLGNDTCLGGDGADQVRGGQGDDSVAGGAGDDFVSGDRGNDTISGGTGADIFHGSQDAGIDRVLDFSSAEGDRVMLDPGTTYTASQVGADTVIDMGGGHQMILVGVQMSGLSAGWVFLG